MDEGKEKNMSEKETVIIDQKGDIAYLTINRPKQHNAMNMAFFNTLKESFIAFDEDTSVRVVVISGEGENFTSGLDLKEAMTAFNLDNTTSGREKMRAHIRDLQESLTWVERCRKPVIAAAHGHCLGGGIDLLSACDIRIASKDVVFSIRETKIAIVADVGTLQRLPHLIGHSWARELALTGRDFTAEEALKMGFITRICPDKKSLLLEADKLAEEIAGNAPLAVQGVKNVMNFSRDNGVFAGLEYVAQKNSAIVVSEDLMEAVGAFMEKRKPVFKGN